MPGRNEDYDPPLDLQFWASLLLSEKETACKIGNLGLISGSGRSPEEGNGNPLQYSCLESPMDGGAWWATVYGVPRVRRNLVTKPPPPGLQF